MRLLLEESEVWVILWFLAVTLKSVVLNFFVCSQSHGNSCFKRGHVYGLRQSLGGFSLPRISEYKATLETSFISFAQNPSVVLTKMGVNYSSVSKEEQELDVPLGGGKKKKFPDFSFHSV